MKMHNYLQRKDKDYHHIWTKILGHNIFCDPVWSFNRPYSRLIQNFMGTIPVCDSCRMPPLPPPLRIYTTNIYCLQLKLGVKAQQGQNSHLITFTFMQKNSLEKKVVIREDMVMLCLSIRLYYKPNDCGKRHQLINVMVNMMFDNKTKMEINLIINLSCKLLSYLYLK